jgi:ABC-type transport system involved in multi-copper enzyme maturation permease subunit
LNIFRVWVIASNVLREVLRDRVLYLGLLFAVVILGATLLLPEVSAGSEGKILLDLGIALIGLFGLIVAVFVGTGLLNKEIEKRTVLVLMAKPMSRTEFIVGKHLGLSTVLAILVALMTAVFFVVMSWKQIDYPLGSLVVAAVYLLLELSLITAVGILFGVFTSSLIATLLTLAVYFMGHFSQNLVTLSNTVDTPSIQRLIQGLYLIFPDLARLDLKNTAVYGSLPSASTLLLNAGYGLTYIVLLLTLATLMFSRRQF